MATGSLLSPSPVHTQGDIKKPPPPNDEADPIPEHIRRMPEAAHT